MIYWCSRITRAKPGRSGRGTTNDGVLLLNGDGPVLNVGFQPLRARHVCNGGMNGVEAPGARKNLSQGIICCVYEMQQR